MREYHELDRFFITGRGLAISVKNPGGYKDGELLGTNVLIDGEEYLVRGVGTFAIVRPYPDNLDFSLLVEKI